MACGGMSLEQQFVNFSKFGDEHADGTTITLQKSDKWMQQAKILDGKKVTFTDTGSTFFKFMKYAINFTQYLQFLEELAKEKSLDVAELKEKLANCGLPGTSNQGENKPGTVSLALNA